MPRWPWKACFLLRMAAERRQPTPSPDQGRGPRSCSVQGAPLWLLGEERLQGLHETMGAAGPWDRHKGHRGAASPACTGQIKLATCSSHQEIRKPNCSILLMSGNPTGTKMQVGPIFKNQIYQAEALHNKRFPPRVRKRLGEPDSQAFIKNRI